MEDTQIVLERHEQKLQTLERDIADLKAVQTEIRSMNETLVTLATELKHTNEHLARHDCHGDHCGAGGPIRNALVRSR